MKVYELLLRLENADPDTVVLLLPSYADYTEAEELVDVFLIAEPWTCERSHRTDGTSIDIHHPALNGMTIGWNAATDESWTERVAILSPQSTH